MKIFKEKGEGAFKLSQEESSKIVVPKILDTYNTSKLDFFIINTLFKLVDYREFNQFMEAVAKEFINYNFTFLENIKNMASDDIEVVWDVVNKFLSSNGLGVSQMEIDLKNRELLIYHYHSPFVRSLSGITNQKACNFLSVLYSVILSKVFEENLNVSEKECSNERKKEFCTFHIV